MTIDFIRPEITDEGDDWLLTESGQPITAETIIGMSGELAAHGTAGRVAATGQARLVGSMAATGAAGTAGVDGATRQSPHFLFGAIDSEDDDWLLTESGDGLVTEQVIGLSGHATAQGTAGQATAVGRIRLVGTVASVGAVGTSAAAGDTAGNADTHIYMCPPPPRRIVGTVAATGTAGEVRATGVVWSREKALADLLALPISQPMAADQRDELQAMAALLNIELPADLAEADFEPIMLLMTDEIGRV